MKSLKDLGIDEVGSSILYDQVFAITVAIAQGTIFKPFEKRQQGVDLDTHTADYFYDEGMSVLVMSIANRKSTPNSQTHRSFTNIV
jgi:hypothetical protein